MIEEKAVAIVCSAVAGSVAAVKSRSSRMRAAEELENALMIVDPGKGGGPYKVEVGGKRVAVDNSLGGRERKKGGGGGRRRQRKGWPLLGGSPDVPIHRIHQEEDRDHEGVLIGGQSPWWMACLVGKKKGLLLLVHCILSLLFVFLATSAATLSSSAAASSATTSAVGYGGNVVGMKTGLALMVRYLQHIFLSQGDRDAPKPSLTHEGWCHVVGCTSLTLLLVHALLIFLYPKIKNTGNRNLWGEEWTENDLEEEAGGVDDGCVPLTEAQVREIQGQAAICNGRWTKNRDLSDSMDPLSDLMRIHGLMRTAIGLINGADIKISGTKSNHKDQSQRDRCVPTLHLNVLSGILWFKIRETYPLDRIEVRHRRRDFRLGGTYGRAWWDADSQLPAIHIHNRFKGKLEGTMVEEYKWMTKSILHVDTTVTIKDGSVSFRQVFNKQQ